MIILIPVLSGRVVGREVDALVVVVGAERVLVRDDRKDILHCLILRCDLRAAPVDISGGYADFVGAGNALEEVKRGRIRKLFRNHAAVKRVGQHTRPDAVEIFVIDENALVCLGRVPQDTTASGVQMENPAVLCQHIGRLRDFRIGPLDEVAVVIGMFYSYVRQGLPGLCVVLCKQVSVLVHVAHSVQRADEVSEGRSLKGFATELHFIRFCSKDQVEKPGEVRGIAHSVLELLLCDGDMVSPHVKAVEVGLPQLGLSDAIRVDAVAVLKSVGRIIGVRLIQGVDLAGNSAEFLFASA